ncbi:hypothetical protein Dip510_000682 [Elusimicrobium posterum]|uniref:LPS assembly lipoprotein LptE n=1 Tax=Elusimicrobium posterum TaxID=3116653 RepID=UPI003C757218
MKKTLPLICALLLTVACTNAVYKPYTQTMPQHINKVAVRPFINNTEVFALEDKLTLRLNDEFLKDGYYDLVRENDADGVIIGQIMRYHLVPMQYDTQMIPTTYRMEVRLNVRFLDRASDTVIWEEPSIISTYIYSAVTLPGGMTEEQAREQLWDRLSKDIVKRTTAGFGSIWSESKRKAQDNPEFNTITQ